MTLPDLSPKTLRSCLFAQYLYEPMGSSFLARVLAVNVSSAPRRASHVRCASPHDPRRCFPHPILFYCTQDTVDARLACVYGTALGMSRDLRFSYVSPHLATLFCSVFEDHRAVTYCSHALLGWTGTNDDPEYPPRYGAELFDAPIQY